MLSLKSKITQAVLGYFMPHDNVELYVNEMALRFSLDGGNLARKLNGVEKAYLFGSYAEDKMDMSSDIDLAVVGDHSTIELQKKISEIQKSVDREINTISINSQEYQEKLKSDLFIKSVHRKKKISIL